ncbi:MAG: type II secretion system protein [Planctomycetaceae bacterium]|jgi:prepilin-type N-terminal cleavage/methylation domain-containing protein|nr:type II secretion system protein [Planctomycetaceae bacterium]
MRYPSRQTQAGFTLMEILVSITILGLSMVAINGLVSIGARNAREAKVLTTAQFLAESKLSEVKTGLLSPNSTGKMPFTQEETIEPFTFEVQSQSMGTDGQLMAIRVVVEFTPEDGTRPLIYQLDTLMIDPQIEMQQDADLTVHEMIMQMEAIQ